MTVNLLPAPPAALPAAAAGAPGDLSLTAAASPAQAAGNAAGDLEPAGNAAGDLEPSSADAASPTAASPSSPPVLAQVPEPQPEPSVTLSYRQHGYAAHRHMFGVFSVDALAVVMPVETTCIPSIDLFLGAAAKRRAVLVRSANAVLASGGGVAAVASILARAGTGLAVHDPLYARSRPMFEAFVHTLRAAAGSLVLSPRVQVLLAAARPRAAAEAMPPSGRPGRLTGHKRPRGSESGQAAAAAAAAAGPSDGADASSPSDAGSAPAVEASGEAAMSAGAPADEVSGSALVPPVAAIAGAMWAQALTAVLTSRGGAPVSALGEAYAVGVAAVDAVPLCDTAATAAAEADGAAGAASPAPHSAGGGEAPPASHECVLVRLVLALRG
jgi:hypothetical protein